jgi:hypothetical protein
MSKKRFWTNARVLAPVALLLVASLLLAAGCGGGGSKDVAGVYKLEAGEGFTATLTLKEGGDATYSITEGAGIPVTYKVEGDTVTLVSPDGQPIPSATFTIVDEGLKDPTGNIYEKQ